jgi:hypothetical protein
MTAPDPRIAPLITDVLFPAWDSLSDPASREVIRAGARRALEIVDAVDPVRNAARQVLSTYQLFLDTDDLDALRDALTDLDEALGTWDQ